ncbi:MAG: hypothetical protein GKS05_02385 [Nitrospirales bacterium]|nr:hypothetical protein [Nitrospirales bacterium]
MNEMKPCPFCQRDLPHHARFCPHCGKQIPAPADATEPDALNIHILYLMVGTLIIALLFPPWESPPGDPPQYLGFHFIFEGPTPTAVVSRALQTIELVTIALAGLYGSWYFRGKS